MQVPDRSQQRAKLQNLFRALIETLYVQTPASGLCNLSVRSGRGIFCFDLTQTDRDEDTEVTEQEGNYQQFSVSACSAQN